MIRSLALALALLATPAFAITGDDGPSGNDDPVPPPPYGSSHTLTIKYSEGGDVEEFEEQVLKQTGPIRVVGECDSACTMFLGRKNVCVAPSAKLGFHQGWTPTDKGGAEISYAATYKMAWYWPKGTKALINRRGGLPGPDKLLYISGQEMIDAGIMRRCS